MSYNKSLNRCIALKVALIDAPYGFTSLEKARTAFGRVDMDYFKKGVEDLKFGRRAGEAMNIEEVRHNGVLVGYFLAE